MGILGKARHNLGFHTGDWTFDVVSSCEQTRRCTGCANVSTRTRHELAGWDFRQPREDNGCVKDRTCSRCGLAETEQDHAFSWHYYNQVAGESGVLNRLIKADLTLRHPCRQFYACEYCGERKGSDRDEHVWSRSSDEKDEQGYWYRYCARCDKEDRYRI